MSRTGSLLLACALALPASVAAAGPVKMVGAGGGSALLCSCEPDADAPGQGQCVEIDPGVLCSSLVTCDTAADCQPDEVCVASSALACGSENKCLPGCLAEPGQCAHPSPDPETLTPCVLIPALRPFGALLFAALLLASMLLAIRRRGRRPVLADGPGD